MRDEFQLTAFQSVDVVSKSTKGSHQHCVAAEVCKRVESKVRLVISMHFFCPSCLARNGHLLSPCLPFIVRFGACRSRCRAMSTRHEGRHVDLGEDPKASEMLLERRKESTKERHVLSRVAGPRSVLTLEDVSLLQTKCVASCEETQTGIAENACCHRHG